ncbi:ribbon-helix-helix domain-containing protein [Phenylobacterium sp. VNQ135]|uniref:ribbon-helix-helix domain-containing protein n=1 Tax=Phenylobacterium sp. VNQ135 TaxID=3400922 RepID=UPI003C086634
MSRFASIRSERTAKPPPEEPAEYRPRSPGRSGKKAVSGYFSPDVSRGLHLLALEQGTSLQALMGEAFDDLMRKYGKHPFGER